MLIIDRREQGIVELLSRFDVPVSIAELEYGDALFTGNGPKGECTVAVERKRLSDLINSMTKKRLSGHQLRGCWKAYDFVFVFAEGIWRPGPGGEIQIQKFDYRTRKRDWGAFFTSDNREESRGISYRQLMSYLTTLELRGNVVVRRTASDIETAVQYATLWHWFNDKMWAEHTAHDQLYTGAPVKGHGGNWAEDHGHNNEFGKGRAGSIAVEDDNPSTLWRMASQLPGIDRRAYQVAKHFRTVEAMVLATEKEWREIEGIGPKIAAAVVRALREEGA